MSRLFTRRVDVVPTILTVLLLSAIAATPAQAHGHGGGGHSSAGGHHSGGGGYNPGATHNGGHSGGGRLASSAAASSGVPWNQPVMQPDQLPEARLARYVHHLIHPHGD
jgi:hypothetical protein